MGIIPIGFRSNIRLYGQGTNFGAACWIVRMAALTINGQAHEVDSDPDTPLLWVLRDTLGLMGTKYGCGIGQCGACTVHIDGTPIRSCALPLRAVAGKAVTTIEGLPENGALHK